MSGNRQPAVNNRPLSERPWLYQRGTSGNPTGRTASKDIAALARKYAPAAICALVQALEDPRTRVPAAVALLNRGYGLPTQPVEGEGAQSFTVMHLIAAREIAAQMQAAIKTGAPMPPTIDAVMEAQEVLAAAAKNGIGTQQPPPDLTPALE
jgi:hypothetical protein